jgi:AAA domain
VRSDGIPAEISEELGLKNGHRSVPPPITHTGNELRHKVFPPVRLAIPEMLAEGVTLSGGREKMGKSLLALGLCIATATGGHALGKVPVEQGESLYISLEDNERRLQDRVKTLTDHDTDLGMLHYADGWLRSDEGGTEQLDMFLTERPNTRLVVLIRDVGRGSAGFAPKFHVAPELQSLHQNYKVFLPLDGGRRKGG